MFNTLLYQPLFQALMFLTRLLGGSLGLSLIAFTLLMRVLLIPLTLPSLKSAEKLKNLKPELDKLKAQHKDKAQLQLAQLELYKKHGINPAAGCLPNLLQFAILIAMYQVFINFLAQNGTTQTLNLNFLWLNLSRPDPYFILPLLAGLTQLLLSLMLTPALEHHQETTPQKTEDTQEMAQNLQQQMLLIMPVMTVLISLKFPSGLALYWLITTVFSLVQQYYLSGWGGLTKYFAKVKLWLNLT